MMRKIDIFACFVFFLMMLGMALWGLAGPYPREARMNIVLVTFPATFSFLGWAMLILKKKNKLEPGETVWVASVAALAGLMVWVVYFV